MPTHAERLARKHGQLDILGLENVTDRQLSRILYDIAQEAEDLIARNLQGVTIGAAVRRAQLTQAIKGLGNLAQDLWDSVDGETRKGVLDAARLAADQGMDLDFLYGMPTNAIAQYAEFIYFDAAHSADLLMARRANQISLGSKVFANGRESVRAVGKLVDRGLALQMSAKEIAYSVRKHFSPNVPGGTSYAAKRLARTEINNAHHRVTVEASKHKPWVEGFKWNLSGSHPRPDQCNDYAEHSEGLGAGVWSKESVPGKPHPQCLCYLTTISPSPDEFVNNLVNGKYDNALDEMGVNC